MCSLEELHAAVQRARRVQARAEQRKARQESGAPQPAPQELGSDTAEAGQETSDSPVAG
jgi:hypothetical protein